MTVTSVSQDPRQKTGSVCDAKKAVKGADRMWQEFLAAIKSNTGVQIGYAKAEASQSASTLEALNQQL
jgi:hypothetical protein